MAENLLVVPYVRTADNLADFFTKALEGDTFVHMRDEIMNCGTRDPRTPRTMPHRK